MSDPRDILTEGHAGGRPSCFDSDEQFAEYEAARKLTSKHQDGNFCMDCDAVFKCKMLEDMRCDHPETKFVVINSRHDREVIGVSIKSVYWDRVKAGKRVIHE